MKRLVWCLYALVGLSGGCAHVMSEGGLALIDRSISYTEIRKNSEALTGKNVLVGGIISGNRSSGDVMQLEVTQLELLSNGVPDETSHSAGRFMVVSGDLLDPLIYHPGTLITLIGEIKGQQVQKREGADYHYPLLSAKEIRLFRASDAAAERPSNPYQNRFGDERFMRRPHGGY